MILFVLLLSFALPLNMPTLDFEYLVIWEKQVLEGTLILLGEELKNDKVSAKRKKVQLKTLNLVNEKKDTVLLFDFEKNNMHYGRVSPHYVICDKDYFSFMWDSTRDMKIVVIKKDKHYETFKKSARNYPPELEWQISAINDLKFSLNRIAINDWQLIGIGTVYISFANKADEIYRINESGGWDIFKLSQSVPPNTPVWVERKD